MPLHPVSFGSLLLRGLSLVVILTTLTLSPPSAGGQDFNPGYQPAAFAIEGATIIPAPGEQIEDGTLLIRDGAIEAVGPASEIKIPVDAERISGQGLYVYPGLIDAYSTLGIDGQVPRSTTGAGRSIDYSSFALAATPADNRSGLTPEFSAAEALSLAEKDITPRREAGFATLVIAPGGGIVTGQSAVVALSGGPRREIIQHAPLALHAQLTPGDTRSYPSTLMGCVAHLRQAMLDAEHHARSWEHFRAQGGRRPPQDPALETLRGAARGDSPVYWYAESRDDIHRALDLSEEFGFRPVIVGGQEAYRVKERLRAANVPVILQIDFPEKPKTGAPDAAADPLLEGYTLEQLKQGLDRPDIPDDIKDRIRQRIAALENPSPAETAAKSKSSDKPPRVPESQRLLTERQREWSEKVACARELAAAGVRFCFTTHGHAKPADFAKHWRQTIEAGLSNEAALAALTTSSAEILGLEERLGRLAPGYAAHVVIFDKPLTEEKRKLRYSFVDGERAEFNKPDKTSAKPDSADEAADTEPASEADQEPDATDEAQEKEEDEEQAATSEEAPAESTSDPAVSSTPEAESADKPADAESEESSAEEKPEPADQPATPAFPIETEQDRRPQLTTGGTVAIRGATLLTVTQGTIEDGTLLIQDGKIAAIGKDIEIPKGVTIIPGEGLFVMPGIIDTHSHIAISRGINEATLSVTPECRIRDVISGDDIGIYRALAGGVTTCRILHGSANAIGGQDAVIKLRWGLPGRELILQDAPRGVKFALGENPKRRTGRYPDTRLGVESTIRRSFDEAQMYRRIWQAYGQQASQGGTPLAPRRDLRLEALADMLSGDLRIHSHCYRADEILMLMRLTEEYGVRVRSLQHVLEGYKVAAEIAQHGAYCSPFSDWWAYKVEAYDAIPHNTDLLIRAGVNVSLKSDDAELMRHMYQEAAKMLRYGDLSLDEALALITINPAEQLDLGDRLGSLEVGKDADLAIFDRHPLDSFARCQLTLVDGEVYFQNTDTPKSPAPTAVPLVEEELRQRTLEIPHAPRGRYLLTDARIVPVEGEVIERGNLLIVGGRIEKISANLIPTTRDTVIVPLDGLSVYPGMINSGGALGLTEIGSVRETHDYSESGLFNADLRASLAVHPDSEVIPVTRAGGVLTTLTQPEGGRISGQSVLLNLHGWIAPEMAVMDPAALHINFPRGLHEPGSTEAKTDRQKKALEEIQALREQFARALRYGELLSAAGASGELGPVPDPNLEALLPYARAELPVVIHANSHSDILAALDFAEEHHLNWILADAAEAWKCAAELKQHDVPVILGPAMQLPGDQYTPYDAPYRAARVLHEAGVRFAIKAVDSGPGSATSGHNLPFQAAMAIAYGLPEAEGLKAVTLYPAQILGAEDDLGSLAAGKLANLVITDGHLLQPSTRIKHLFVAGRPVPPTSKHTKLHDRYIERLEEVQSGQSMLGVDGPRP